MLARVAGSGLSWSKEVVSLVYRYSTGVGVQCTSDDPAVQAGARAGPGPAVRGAQLPAVVGDQRLHPARLRGHQRRTRAGGQPGHGHAGQ